MTKLRVAVWTTGNVIRQAVRAIVARPDLELVGAFARSAEKHGVDVGTLCGLPSPLGVTATTDVDELLGRGVDCVVHSPLHLDVVRVQQRWLASPHVDPAWTVEPGYRVEVLGDPNVALRLDTWPTDADLADLTKATMHGIGMRITAVPVVNAIPAVWAAPPGIATYVDLPVIASPVRPDRRG